MPMNQEQFKVNLTHRGKRIRNETRSKPVAMEFHVKSSAWKKMSPEQREAFVDLAKWVSEKLLKNPSQPQL